VIITSPYAPMLVAVLGAAASLLLGAWRKPRAAVQASVYGLVIGTAIAGVQAQNAMLTVDPTSTGPITALPVAVCLAIGSAVLAASMRALSANGPGPRIAALSALAAAAAAFMTSVSDLLLLFIAVETLALCGYGLVAIGGTVRAREAAMKWFVQGSVATAVFIVGLGVLVVQTGGNLEYGALAALATSPASSVPLAVGFSLVLSALAFKGGAFPFHSWMPDAFKTGPAPGIAMLASVGKIAPLSAVAYLVLAMSGATGDRVAPVIAALAVGSIVFGNLVALRQRSLARMLAYSGVAQIGYGFVGLVIGANALVVLFFAGIYAISSAASFLFIVAMNDTEPEWDGSIDGLAGLSRRHPALAAGLAAIMFSLTGVPLTAGFWGKFAVLGATATYGWAWLAIVAMLGSVVSFGYYGRVLRTAFMSDEAEAGEVVAPESVASAEAPAVLPSGLRGPSPAYVATVVFAAVIVLVGVAPFLMNSTVVGAFLP
jgi:NADH-quinone oxidoreductase subunit N